MSERDPSDRFRKRLEGAIPELIKRAVELGVEKAHEAPDAVKQLVGDLKLPKEVVGYIFSQVDETKNGLFRIFAKEMRDFLEHTNITGEMQKLLDDRAVRDQHDHPLPPERRQARRQARGGDRERRRGRPREGRRQRPSPDSPRTPSSPPPGSIPRPEVMTDVFVRRDGRSDRKDRERSGRDE